MEKLNILSIKTKNSQHKIAFDTIFDFIWCNVVEKYSEVEALATLKNHKFDIIFIEEQLLMIDGYSLADIISGREKENKSETAIIIISKASNKTNYSVFKGDYIVISEKGDIGEIEQTMYRIVKEIGKII